MLVSIGLTLFSWTSQGGAQQTQWRVAQATQGTTSGTDETAEFLKRSIVKLRREVDQKQKEIDEVTNLWLAQNAELKTEKKKNEKLAERIGDLQRLVNGIDACNPSSCPAMAELQTKLEAKEIELQAALATGSSGAQISTTDAGAEQTKARIEKLESQLKEAQEKRAELQGRIRDANGQLRRIESRTSELQRLLPYAPTRGPSDEVLAALVAKLTAERNAEGDTSGGGACKVAMPELEVVLVPAGSYTVRASGVQSFLAELEVRDFELSKSFCTTREEVSVSLFERFYNEAPTDLQIQIGDAWRTASDGLLRRRPDEPVGSVDLPAAAAFADWLSGKLGRNVAVLRRDQWLAAVLAAQRMGDAIFDQSLRFGVREWSEDPCDPGRPDKVFQMGLSDRQRHVRDTPQLCGPNSFPRSTVGFRITFQPADG